MFRFDNPQEIFESSLYLSIGLIELVYVIITNMLERRSGAFHIWILLAQLGSIAPLVMDPFESNWIRRILANTIQVIGISSYLKIIYMRSKPLYQEQTLKKMRYVCYATMATFELGIIVAGATDDLLISLIGLIFIGIAGLSILAYDVFNLNRFNQFMSGKIISNDARLMPVAIYGRKCICVSIFMNVLFFLSIPISIWNQYVYAIVDVIMLSCIFVISLLVKKMFKEIEECKTDNVKPKKGNPCTVDVNSTAFAEATTLA